MSAAFQFNPLSPEFQANPYPYYEMLRASAPLYYWPDWGMWFLSRYDDCVAALKEPRFGREILRVMTRQELGWPEPPPEIAALGEIENLWMLFRDPPDHTRLRTLVHKAFTPRIVEQMRQDIERLSGELLDAVQEKGQMDVIADLAFPLPVTVIADLLGVPLADQEIFRCWSRDLAATLEMTEAEEVFRCGAKAAAEFSAYCRALADERRRQPQDDLLSALVAVSSEEERLSEDELISTCILLLVAGHETTVNLIGNGTLALLRHPDQLARLQAAPSLVKSAVEELLRYDSPVQVTFRWVLEDVDFAGQKLRKGQQVSTMLGAANHDPQRFDDPARLDISREDNKHIAFGSGIHFCLGAPLARLEGQIAIGTLIRRLPNLRLADEQPRYRDAWALRGLQSLAVTY